MSASVREDHAGPHRQAFNRAKKKIYATQSHCAICGRPVDFSLKYPNPLAPTIDHIIPIDRGGHPSDIDNLQLAHWICNRRKGDKMTSESKTPSPTAPPKRTQVSNRHLPQSRDWSAFDGS